MVSFPGLKCYTGLLLLHEDGQKYSWRFRSKNATGKLNDGSVNFTFAGNNRSPTSFFPNPKA